VELKRRYDGRGQFQWKIALMDPSGCQLHASRSSGSIDGSGMMMRSAFMLNTDWYESKSSGVAGAELRGRSGQRILASLMILSGSRLLGPLREGKNVADWNIATEIAEKLPAWKPANCLSARNRRAIEKRVRASTAEFRALQITNDPRS